MQSKIESNFPGALVREARRDHTLRNRTIILVGVFAISALIYYFSKKKE
jgi:hypothetical protein